MIDKYNETDLVQGINTNLNFVKNIAIEQADKCAGSIRSTLEYAIKLFWLKKYDKKPVWVKGPNEVFDLHKAITDERFSQFFNEIVLGDMHIIRKTCNAVIHDGAPLTLEDAKELLMRLEKCVKAIETTIPMEIITLPNKELRNIIAIDDTQQQSIVTVSQKHITHPTVNTATVIAQEKSFLTSSAKTYDSNSEQTVFWKMLQDALDNNGNPFTISTRAQYGTVNRKSPNSNLCLGFDFLLQKEFFRIGIYIQDDTITTCFERLFQQKDEIESLLGFAPIWTTQGAKNTNTRRIETRLPFTAYDREDYERLIEEALPIFMQYIKVFSKYLPEAFLR